MLLLIILLILVIAMFVCEDDCLVVVVSIFLTLVVSIILSIIIHSNDLAVIRSGKPLIEIREQAIKDIDNQLNKLEYNHTSLMNADTPVKSLIETKSKYISELTNAKLRIQIAKITIEARSIGFFKLVVWLYGKE